MLMLHFLTVSYHSNNTKLFLKKLYVNGLEVMHRYINSVTTGQARIKGQVYTCEKNT